MDVGCVVDLDSEPVVVTYHVVVGNALVAVAVDTIGVSVGGGTGVRVGGMGCLST